MNIVISNDDGYEAPGIRALAKRLMAAHTVTIVAPEKERSGYSHMANFYGGIKCERVNMDDGIPTYAVSGSPADCVMFAVKHIFRDSKIDCVLSGINNTSNLGSDIMFSGTFGAAQEGTFHRIPSIAVSLRTHGTEDYAFAADFVCENLQKLMSFATENITVNLNIPSPRRENIKGVKAAPIDYRPYDERYICVESGEEKFYFVDGKPLEGKNPECDFVLSKEGYITVTPIQMLANDEDTLRRMREESFVL